MGTSAWSNDSVTTFVVPTGHDPNTGPVIVLDGTTGTETLIGSGGGKIILDPNNAFPQIEFLSRDGTNTAFINAVTDASPSQVDLGINSGKVDIGDGIFRTGRLYLNDSNDQVSLEWVETAAPNHRNGGYFVANAFGCSIGYNNNGTIDYFFTMSGTGLSLDGTRVYLIDHPAKDYDASATLTLTNLAQPIAGCTTGTDLNGLRAGAVWTAILTCDSSIGAVAGITTVGELVVDGVTQTKQVLHATGANTRGTFTQKWSGTFAAAGNHTISATGRFVGGASTNTFNATHTSLQVQVAQS